MPGKLAQVAHSWRVGINERSRANVPSTSVDPEEDDLDGKKVGMFLT
jgi:hypothetical protein